MNLTADEILNEYRFRGVTFGNEDVLRNDEQWIMECTRCAVCDDILLHDDEAYFDEELKQSLCDRHSAFDEADDMYKRTQDESFRLKYSDGDLSYSLNHGVHGAVKLFHKGKYVTHLDVYNECGGAYEEADAEPKSLQYVIINYEIVRLYDIKEIT